MINILFFTNTPNLRQTISGKGRAAAVVDNYQDAVNILDQAFISLMVMDFNIPEIKCRALLEYAHDYYPDIPVLALSAVPFDPEEFTPNISATYVNAPYNENEVGAIIESELKLLSQGGKISNVSPPSFAQLLAMEGKSGVLRVFTKQNKWGGLLVFKDGRLTHARFSEFRGIEAACRILTWDETDIYIQNKAYPFEDTINSDLQSIIVKSVHMKDEGQTGPAAVKPRPAPKKPAAPAPKPEPAAAAPAPAPPPPVKQKKSFPEALESFLAEQLGGPEHIGQVTSDPEAEEKIHELSALGPIFELGGLRVICADEGIEKGLHVAGPIPTTVKIPPQSSLEKITVLITRFLDTI